MVRAREKLYQSWNNFLQSSFISHVCSNFCGRDENGLAEIGQVMIRNKSHSVISKYWFVDLQRMKICNVKS